MVRNTHINCSAAHSINFIHLVAFLPPAAREHLQVGVVHGEVAVVFLQDLSRRPLYGELTQGVAGGLTVRRPDHLDVVDRGEVPQLYQEDGQVVDE